MVMLFLFCAHRELLDETSDITLNSSWKDVRRLIKDDPRYVKFSSSERVSQDSLLFFIIDYNLLLFICFSVPLYIILAIISSKISVVSSVKWDKKSILYR